MWKQRSRDIWVKDGDKNIKYFHASASRRRNNNRVACVRNEQGEIITEVKGIKMVF